MKKLLLFFPVFLGVSLFAAAESEKVDVIVKFNEPEKFTDFREDSFNSDKGREHLQEVFTDHLQSTAKKYLAAGQKLEVTFTDIDLAGDFEPWRSPRWDDVRFMKDIYPPRMKFDFKLLDASGAVVKEGSRQVQDLAYQMNLTFPRDDALRYDKELLSDWLRDEFRKPSSKK